MYIRFHYVSVMCMIDPNSEEKLSAKEFIATLKQCVTEKNVGKSA